MSITPRDRKILMVLLPLVLLAGYWFAVLAPKRAESAKVDEELTKVRGERDTAQAQVGQLNAAKASFASDYQTVIRMGKAIPESVDMPSLLVQLDRAARGTGVDMREIKVTPKGQSGGSAPAPPGGGGNPGAGGNGAQSMPGKAAQGAGNAVNNANDKSQQSADAGNAPQGGGAAGGAAPGGAAPGGQQAPGLESVGLTFSMGGEFFEVADFFHRMKRFVRVVNDQIVVRGRLLSIDSFNFSVGETGDLKAEVGATVWLSPKTQGGVDAGASPGGPAPASPASPGGNVAADPASQSPSPSAPTASATP
jgi:hypothetical protein